MEKKKQKKRKKNTQHILTEMNRSSDTPGSVTIEFTYFGKRYRRTAFEVTYEPMTRNTYDTPIPSVPMGNDWLMTSQEEEEPSS